jgi:hypothetical protein
MYHHHLTATTTTTTTKLPPPPPPPVIPSHPYLIECCEECFVFSVAQRVLLKVNLHTTNTST